MAVTPIGETWACPKCGHSKASLGVWPKVSWSSDKPKKILIQCGACGYTDQVKSLDDP